MEMMASILGPGLCWLRVGADAFGWGRSYKETDGTRRVRRSGQGGSMWGWRLSNTSVGYTTETDAIQAEVVAWSRLTV